MRSFCTLIAFCLLPSFALAAQSGFSLRSIRFGLDYTLYSGTRGSSLAGGQGFGVSASSYSGYSLIGITSRFRLGYGFGSFVLGSTSTTQTHINTEMGLGLRINFIPAKSPIINPYLGGNGLLGLMHLTLPSSIANSVSGASSSNTALAFGYEILAGVDVNIGNGKRSLYLEAVLRNVSASIAGQSSLSTGGITLSGGVSINF